MFSLQAMATEDLTFIEVTNKMLCTDSASLIKSLQDTHKEYPHVVGVEMNGMLVIVWKHIQTNDFTVTVSSQKGDATCIVLAGQKLRIVNERGL